MEQNSYYHVRRMRDGDIDQALEIDLDAFPTQWPHPTANSFHHELRNKLAHYLVIYRQNDSGTDHEGSRTIGVKEIISYIRHLFDHDRFFGPEKTPVPKEYLVGIAGIWMMVDEAHVTTIAVRRSHKLQGLGEWLLICIIELALQLKAKMITLEVRLSNTVAQSLYEKYGFVKAGIRKKYYSDNAEDALIMSADELTSSSFQSKFQQLKAEHRTRWSHCYIQL